jgi:hypothetical protein
LHIDPARAMLAPHLAARVNRAAATLGMHVRCGGLRMSARSARAGSVALLGAALLISLLAAGCAYLYPYGLSNDPFGMSDPYGTEYPFASIYPYGGDDPFASDDPFGANAITFTSGEATMTIDGETIVLDQLSSGPHFLDGLGATVYWSNADGWGLQVYGGGYDDGLPGTVEILRIRTAVWGTFNSDGNCTVTLDEADAQGVHGSATCKNLRWSDMMNQGYGGPSYIEGEPAFDATITFKAVP